MKKLLLCLALLGAALPAGPVGAAVETPSFLVGHRENIVLLGDSITADGHYGQLMQDAMDTRYPERQIRVLSRGSHGDTARRALERLDVDVVQWRPSWVLINFGINDVNGYSVEEFLAHYEVLVNRISRDTSAKIGIVSPLYQDRDTESPKMRELVEGLQKLALKYGVLYVPLYETVRQLRPGIPAGVRYAPDGSHPKVLGYQMFAQTILQALQYPAATGPLSVSVPVTRVTGGGQAPVAGQQFVLPLPQPLQVQLAAPQRPSAQTQRATKPIQVDGKLDEWDQSAPLLLDKPEQRIWGVLSWPRDSFRARAFTTYDDEAWYFGIEVDDSVLLNTPAPRHVVDRDCVEVCLDLRPQAERAAKPAVNFARVPRIAQLILAPAGGEIAQAQVLMGNGDASVLQGVTVASSVTRRGYQMEMRLPKSQFPEPGMRQGTAIGFDFAVVNVDRNSRYLEAVSFRWSGSNSGSFSTREFGNLTLR